MVEALRFHHLLLVATKVNRRKAYRDVEQRGDPQGGSHADKLDQKEAGKRGAHHCAECVEAIEPAQ